MDEKAELELAWAAPLFNALHINAWTTSRLKRGEPLRGRVPSMRASWKRNNHAAADPAEPSGVEPAAVEDTGKQPA